MPAYTPLGQDTVTPFATPDQFNGTPFQDLAANLQIPELWNVLTQATRACENICKRRLAPFTTTETHRAEGIDPDEYGVAGMAGVPMDLAGTVGRSYANALGVNDLIRHIWLDNRAPLLPEAWGNYTVTRLEIVRSIGGNQVVDLSTIEGPEPDTGHVWFRIGTFLPIGSLIRVTYTGGYTTVPADLVTACLSMAASIIIKRLDPSMGSAHDPDLLRMEAIEFLDPFIRD